MVFARGVDHCLCDEEIQRLEPGKASRAYRPVLANRLTIREAPLLIFSFQTRRGLVDIIASTRRVLSFPIDLQ